MGFDNECILNIQSLAGEYFCPVCRLLVYPNEALQSQCTHLYCKPCLTYIVSTSHACPYDGYLVTEADSKPLVESDKTLAETIGKIAVHCLYHRSGCAWQGELSECITHCTGCSFGNSPVVCNRCGTQIVHRQVQEHAQNCPGVQPQAQQSDGSQVATTATGATATATSEQNQATTQAGVATSQAQVAQIATAASSSQDQSQVNTNSHPQAAIQAAPTPEQLYQQQQQYQQYYQQYPGYDPYQQQYQQYGSYQQQAYPQYQQQHPPQVIPVQQPQMYVQAQPQALPQAQPQAQAQAQPQAQVPVRPQAQPQPQVQPQPPTHAYPQAQVGGQPQVQAQVNAPTQLQPSHPHPQMQPQTYAQQPQIYAQAQPHPQQLQVQPHLQQRPQVPQHQQQHSKHTQPQQQTLPYLQPQGAAQTQQSQLQHHTHAPAQPQPQTQPQLQARPQAQPQTQPQHPASHTVTGHQSYPQPQPNQQLVPGASQLHPVHMNHQQQGAPRQMPQHTVQVQAQFPQQQLVQMRPPASHVPMQQQQQQAMLPQGQHPNVPPAQQHVHPQPHQPNQSVHQYPGVHLPHQPSTAQQQAQGQSLYPQAFPGQAPGLAQNTQQPAQFIQQQVVQPQLRPQVHPAALPPASLAQQQLQQNVPISHGLQSHQSQNYAGRPMLPNHGLPHQPFQPSTAVPAGPTSSKMMLSGGLQTYPPRSNIRPQSSAEQQPGYMQQAVPPQSGNESVPFPTSAAPQTHVSSMKAGLLPEAASQVTDSKEAIEQKQESEMKSVDGDKMSEGEGKSSHINSNVKESSESSQTLEKDAMASSQKGLDEPMVKNMVKEEVTAKSESSAGTLPDTSVQKQDGSSHIAQKQDDNSQLEDKEVQVDVPKNLSSQEADVLNRKDVKVPNDAMDSQEKATLQGSTHVSDRNMDSLSLHEKNMLQPQGSRLGPGHMQDSSFLQPGHVVSVSDKQQLPMNFGPSHMHDRMHQRPQIPDQLSQQNIHPHQMQMPGLPSTHMRPQGNALLSQGHPSSAPTHFQQSIAKQPLNSFHPEVFGPGSSAPFGRGPGSFGPQGHLNIGQMPPHHAGGPRIRGDPAGGPPFAGQPPGAFDSQAIIMGRVPQSGQQMPANPMDSESIANKRTGYFDGRPSDSHMPGSADRVPFGQPPNMQSDHMKVNGGAATAVSGGLSNPSFPYASQDRFKHFPEERFRQLPEVNLPGEERISSFSVESGRRSINHREFFDDLKHFPRPTHLSSDHVPKSESYMSCSRPLDMAPHGFTGDARLKHDGSGSTAVSRLLPPYQAGGLRPFDLRDDHTGLHPVLNRSASEFGRLRMDGFPPLRSPGRQFPDIPSSRFGRIEDSDGREARAFGERSKPFNLHSDSNPFLESRFPILPSHLRGEPDVAGNLRLGERAHMRGGDLVGPDILPSHLRSSGPMGPHNLRMGEPGGFGTYPNPLRSGDAGGPGNLPLHLRIGESTLGNLPNHSRPGFSSSMPIHGFASDAGFSNAGEVDPLDHSRKRKHGSMGWCRICKVDCETVEGLEMHSQTREHQKMAMDMVLNIKKDNAKKQKVSSDDHTSQDGETNKARKTNIENHGK